MLESLGQWVQNHGASEGFYKAIQTFVSQTIPASMLKDIRDVSYQVQIKNNIRQNRPELYEDCDYTGGFHERRAKRISIAEKVFLLSTETRPVGVWADNLFSQNAITHEFGHAIGYILGDKEADRLQAASPTDSADEQLMYRYWGISESPLIHAAWDADFKALPDEIRQQDYKGSSKRKAGYFLMREMKDGMLSNNYAPGRQEVFAEAFDILMRGKASTYNHDLFVKHFPNMLRAIRDTVENAYALQLPHRSVV